MANNKLEVMLPGINSGLDFVILTGRTAIFSYENGQKTDKVIGEKFSAVLPGFRYHALDIKVSTTGFLPNITDEQIQASCTALKPIFVKFADCKVAAYSIGGNMVMSATASGVEVVSSK